MGLLQKILTFIHTEFTYLFTAVSGVFSTILSELPDDEIAILHAGIKAASDKIEAGGTTEEAFTAALNVIVNMEGKELSKVGNLLLQAFIQAAAPATAAAVSQDASAVQ